MWVFFTQTPVSRRRNKPSVVIRGYINTGVFEKKTTVLINDDIPRTALRPVKYGLK